MTKKRVNIKKKSEIIENNIKIKVYELEKVMSDSEIAKKEGNNFNESHYGLILKDNADVYEYHENPKKRKLLLKLRKNVIPKNLTDDALESFVEAAKKKHENRGAAAGVLDRKKLRGYVGELVSKGKYRTGYISNKTGDKSGQLVSNLAPSNIVGYFDKPDRNLKGHGAPCRLTAFNRDNVSKWKNAIPFIRQVNKVFKQLVPQAYKKQRARAMKTPNFIIPKTCFSTVTINYSWRTSLHKDAGDFKGGYGNLVVIEDPKNSNTYNGCYIGFPQYGVCSDLRTGDFIAMDVHEWHCNTEFKKKSGSRQKKSPSKRKTADSKNDKKNQWDFNRLSMVFYLREGMIKCANKKNTKNKKGYTLKTKRSLENKTKTRSK